MTATRQVSDLVAGLRDIIGLLEASGVQGLPGPVRMYVDFMTSADSGEAEQRLTVDRFVAVTGVNAGYDPSARPTARFVSYETTLEPVGQAWQVRAHAYVRRPELAAELAAENARLREQLAALTAPAVPGHSHVGGAAGGPGQNEAACACGDVFAGFGTHAEATAALDEHIARAAPDVQPQDLEPVAADRCSSGDPWCTPVDPCAADRPPADGHVYECCGKVGRISRHEPWCEAGAVRGPVVVDADTGDVVGASYLAAEPTTDPLPEAEAPADGRPALTDADMDGAIAFLSVAIDRDADSAVGESQPTAAARCSIDPWCTATSPCRACVHAELS